MQVQYLFSFSSALGLYHFLRKQSGSLATKCSTLFTNKPLTVSLLFGVECAEGSYMLPQKMISRAGKVNRNIQMLWETHCKSMQSHVELQTQVEILSHQSQQPLTLLIDTYIIIMTKTNKKCKNGLSLNPIFLLLQAIDGKKVKLSYTKCKLIYRFKCCFSPHEWVLFLMC